jgi:glycosyltransferase involved in cell wall biosynthesis
MKKPLVSIIMNCFNGEKYLNESLASVLDQDFNNWELIFWDNQSKDGSKKIFMRYKDRRFKYFYANKFTNLYTARNLAIKRAKGKILSFIDVDDLWLPNKLKKQVEFFENNKKAEIVYSNYFIQRQIFGIKYKRLKFEGLLPSGNILKKLLKLYTIGWLTVSLRKTLIKNKSNFFNENLDMVADFDLMIRLSSKKKIFCIQEPLAIYRYHANQLTRSNLYNQVDHFLNWAHLAKRKKIIKNYNNYNSIKNKIRFFEEIQFIKKGNFPLSRFLSIFLSGNIKLFIKLIVFYFFPNFFIKYIISI